MWSNCLETWINLDVDDLKRAEGIDLEFRLLMPDERIKDLHVVTRDTTGEIWAQGLSVVAAQFVEAACRARNGDPEATRAHVAHALSLLEGLPSLGPSGTHLLSNRAARVMRGGLPAWQARRVSAHVEGNISARIHIKQLARLVGLSASHFCRAFKCSFGASPRDYVLRRRIEVAQALMLTTPAPLSAIAASCGMCDQQHFTRSFRRIVGESPSDWRRARQGVLQIK